MLRLFKKSTLSRRHEEVVAPACPSDFDRESVDLVTRVQPFTMTTPERIAALKGAVEYVVQAGIPGNIVECGVWKGGSTMAAALTLMKQGDLSRQLWLFDTFEGMTEPNDMDRDLSGKTALQSYREFLDTEGSWCYSPLEEVQDNLRSTGYPADKMNFIKGKVEETIPGHLPGQIALLRLDTDWYESTRHELIHLYPLLAPGGVLVIDDYGHWSGARQAVDEYFAEHGIHPLLHRVDYTARICVKSHAA